ncbi:hypothetical protein JRQ81_009491 [Phrynocephalus forsythii]|uniref:Uncharacterized protein n=1 Tax=Phrynocephalus forsythii TaxID=171643 RepID=A0A9Q0XBW5_9SAUR|nr:hypothetical protein JRQ81_009491 [Phrynocephalus forsythii]
MPWLLAAKHSAPEHPGVMPPATPEDPRGKQPSEIFGKVVEELTNPGIFRSCQGTHKAQQQTGQSCRQQRNGSNPRPKTGQKVSGSNVQMARLEFTSAYGSISHNHIFGTLVKFRIPEDILALVYKLYKCSFTAMQEAEDEMVVITEMAEEVQEMFEMASTTADQMGLKFNTGKWTSLYSDGALRD